MVSPMQPNYMKKKARSAYKDYTAPYKKDEDEDEEAVGSEPAAASPSTTNVNVTVQKEKEKAEEEKKSGWGKKVAAAIAGTIGAVAGANLQHKNNERRRKMYEAKRKTGNYL